MHRQGTFPPLHLARTSPIARHLCSVPRANRVPANRTGRVALAPQQRSAGSRSPCSGGQDAMGGPGEQLSRPPSSDDSLAARPIASPSPLCPSITALLVLASRLAGTVTSLLPITASPTPRAHARSLFLHVFFSSSHLPSRDLWLGPCSVHTDLPIQVAEWRIFVLDWMALSSRAFRLPCREFFRGGRHATTLF
jgi:hypothetical protein